MGKLTELKVGKPVFLTVSSSPCAWYHVAMQSPRFPKLSDLELTNRIVERYHDKGWTIKELADHYGIANGTVLAALERRGVPRRKRGRPSGDEETLRRCLRCNGTMPLNRFSHDKSKAQGHSYYCKECDRERKRRPPLDE